VSIRKAAARPALSVWVRLMKAHNLLLREARRSVGRDMTLPQFDVMAHLARRPEGMTAGELSRLLLVSAGNLTGIVDRLEREGLAKREAHESDRRATRIRLTPWGRRRIGRLVPRHAHDIEQLLAPLSASELSGLRDLLGRLNGALEGRAGAAPEPLRRATKEKR